eukprot:gene4219-8394_t
MKEAKPCTHPALYNNICVACGKNLSRERPIEDLSDVVKDPWGNKMSFKGGHTLLLSNSEASIVQNGKIKALRQSNKLALILDLDNTIMHASSQCPDKLTDEIHPITLQEQNVHCKYWVKLRPNAINFLKSVINKYQLFIYTHGTRQYAQEIANILDPTGTYFGQRILSRTDVPDLGSRAEKSLDRIFLGDLSMAVIMDDREDVWKGPQKLNLMQVHPYVYFADVLPVQSKRPSSVSASVTVAVSTVDGANVGSSPVSTGVEEVGVVVISDQSGSDIISSVMEVEVEVEVEVDANDDDGEDDASIPIFKGIQTEDDSSLHDKTNGYSNNNNNNVNETDVTHIVHNTATATTDASNALTEIEVEVVKDTSEVDEEEQRCSQDKDKKEDKKDDEDSQLMRCSVILNQIHEEYYTRLRDDNSSEARHKPPSVGSILSNLKLKVLAGCRLVFSGLIPKNHENPRLHHWWRLAESLGAVVTESLEVGTGDGKGTKTTHLIVVSHSTQKAQVAKERGDVWIVHPNWLSHCLWSLDRVEEAKFLMGPHPVCIPQLQLQPQPAMNNNTLQTPSVFVNKEEDNVISSQPMKKIRRGIDDVADVPEDKSVSVASSISLSQSMGDVVDTLSDEDEWLDELENEIDDEED